MSGCGISLSSLCEVHRQLNFALKLAKISLLSSNRVKAEPLGSFITSNVVLA